MANLTRYDPFRDMDDMFRGLMLQPVRMDRQAPQIKMDVKESNGNYVIHADIPGVKKEDITVNIDGNIVSISAEVKEEKEVKEGERVVRSERYHGSVSRAFALDQDVDDKAAIAKYTDGVLELTLPKKAASRQGKVVVQ
jgi:HSP20 family protein